MRRFIILFVIVAVFSLNVDLFGKKGGKKKPNRGSNAINVNVTVEYTTKEKHEIKLNFDVNIKKQKIINISKEMSVTLRAPKGYKWQNRKNEFVKSGESIVKETEKSKKKKQEIPVYLFKKKKQTKYKLILRIRDDKNKSRFSIEHKKMINKKLKIDNTTHSKDSGIIGYSQEKELIIGIEKDKREIEKDKRGIKKDKSKEKNYSWYLNGTKLKTCKSGKARIIPNLTARINVIYKKQNNKEEIDVITKNVLLEPNDQKTNYHFISGVESSTISNSNATFSTPKFFIGINGISEFWKERADFIGEVRLGRDNNDPTGSANDVLQDTKSIIFSLGSRLYISYPGVYIKAEYTGSYFQENIAGQDFKNKFFAGFGSRLGGTKGLFRFSYLEAGWGISENFNKKNKRFKINGRLNINVPGADFSVFLDSKYDTDFFGNEADDFRVMLGMQFHILKIVDIIKTPFTKQKK